MQVYTIFSSWEEFGWVGFQNSPLLSQTLNVPTEEDLNNESRKFWSLEQNCS